MSKRLEFITFITAEDGGTIELSGVDTIEKAIELLPEYSDTYEIEYVVRIVIDGASFNCEDVSEQVFEPCVEKLWVSSVEDVELIEEVNWQFHQDTLHLKGRLGRLCEART